MKLFYTFIIALFVSFSAFSQTSSEAEIEARAREVGRAIRCVVCQNQSIDESDASLAQDMRKLVRARIRAGDSNDEVISFMQNRYGDFVLLKPPVQTNTYLLWFAPAILFGFFLLWYVVRVRRKPVKIEPQTLSADELKRFEKLTINQETDT
ncbi:MAG: cytochrome C biogenesis protein [Robiginitomaculum sp.]|nr:MAG: cytochrome C biogenesis protein [Robiginitomaculum sp.]